MTPTVVRVMLSLALVPLAPWLYAEVLMFSQRYNWAWPGTHFAIATLIVGSLTMAGYGLIWLTDPIWLSGRGARRAFAWAASIALAVLLVLYHEQRSERELGLVLSGLLGVGAWCVAAGVLAHRTSVAAARVLYALAFMPLVPWLYVEVFLIADSLGRSVWPMSGLALATLIAGGLALAGYGLIRLMDPVGHEGRGIRAAVAWSVSLAMAVLLVVHRNQRSEHELGLLLSGLLGAGVWCVAAGVLAHRMSAAGARILHALAFVPLAPSLYVELFGKFEAGVSWSYEAPWLLTTLLTGALVVAAWLVIWRKAVAWTAARAVKTLLVLAIGVLSAVAVREYHRSDWGEVGFLLGGLCFAAVWLAGTAWAWRPTAADRLRLGGTAVETVYCPKCRYDLRGLREARCPECGTEYTLDALVRAAYPTPPPP